MPDLLASLQEVLGTRYRLEGELGHGGMATVYRAVDDKHHRPVAIKVLPPELASVMGADRFQREIAVASGLSHPNIVPLFDSGGDGDLLYYIMPLVGGETLRARLDREAQLPVEDVVRIARDLGEALGYAHAQGIVHRDIKPENILLQGDRALVTDFGIARAIGEAGGERLTQRGLGIGTPLYMSPEQCGGSDQIDGRSDLYSLGCVMFEMLTGDPPFPGRTAQAIMARHMQELPPPIDVRRPAVPLGVRQVIERLLAKVPADRYPTSRKFTEALDEALSRPSAFEIRVKRRWQWPTAVAVTAALATAAVVLWPNMPLFRSAEPSLALDTSVYAVLPFERSTGANSGLPADHLLQDALGRWAGITVVDAFLVRDAAARRGDVLDARGAREAAVELGAGRYVRAEISPIGDSLRVHASLYDATGGATPLADTTVRMAALDLRGAEAVFARIADHLLFRGGGTGGRVAMRTATSSVPALQAFARGHQAIEQWDLGAAAIAFQEASRFDSTYAQAFLWLAQVSAWRGARAVNWAGAAERAASMAARLPARDQRIAEALVALARGDYQRACPIWRGLTQSNPADFAAWYGLGNCVGRDDVVLPDPASPSGWRFRSSKHEAATAYENAFQRLPSIHRALRRGSFEFVRQVLRTAPNQLRSGRAAPPDTQTFYASASWAGDTMAFVPYPALGFAANEARSPANRSAVRHQRERFHQLAVAWAEAFPASSEALEALAVSLEMLGDPAAIDTLRRARQRSESAEARVRLAAAEVWFRVRRGAPDDLGELRAAARLADSILRANPPPDAREPRLLAGLAALTGKSGLAARYAGSPVSAVAGRVPPPLSSIAEPLVLLSAIGAGTDTLRQLERRLMSAIRLEIPPLEQRSALDQWPARAATLAFPTRLDSWGELLAGDDMLLDAQDAMVRGDTVSVRRMFADLVAARRFLQPADITLDAVVPEARLLAMLDSPQVAIRWLEPSLLDLRASAPQAFEDPTRAASLVPALILRAELAARLADTRGLRRWSDAAAALWSDPDPMLQPVIRRLRRPRA